MYGPLQLGIKSLIKKSYRSDSMNLILVCEGEQFAKFRCELADLEF